jgi:hypothetical protein
VDGREENRLEEERAGRGGVMGVTRGAEHNAWSSQLSGRPCLPVRIMRRGVKRLALYACTGESSGLSRVRRFIAIGIAGIERQTFDSKQMNNRWPHTLRMVASDSR